MRRLARQDIAAAVGAIKRRAQLGQLQDVITGLLGDAHGDIGIHRARPGLHRVMGVVFGAVIGVHRGGHTALRPSRTGPFAQNLGRDHDHGARRKTQGGIKRA